MRRKKKEIKTQYHTFLLSLLLFHQTEILGKHAKQDILNSN